MIRRGISLMLSKEPSADFKEVAGLFISVFKRKNYEKTSEKKLGEKLGENEIKILEFASKNKYITTKELAKKIGIITTAIDKNIAKLKNKGILKRVGPDKGGYWEVLEKVERR